MLEHSETVELLLTHSLVPGGPIPTVQDPDGVYPYESFCETSRRPVLKAYRMVTIENARIRIKICPDLGGRVCSMLLKETATESLYFPDVIRPARILPRQAFTGGGIEVSFPISHTPVNVARVICSVTKDSGRIYVSCGEREIRYGMHWTVEYSLGEADAFLSQRTVFFNPGATAHPWMSWSNAGVPARPDSEFHFPGGPVLTHGREVRTIDWETEGPQRQSDVRRMTGYFWTRPDCQAFGVFTPSLGTGLYHVADPSSAPGIKLWTDGVGRDERWVSQYTLDGDQCLEIQAGPLIDQSTRELLRPGQLHQHVEYWIPASRRRAIREIQLPAPRLRPVSEVPLFDWARSEDVGLWLQLVAAHRASDPTGVPSPPGVDSNQWAISGCAELGPALAWAASTAQGDKRDRWFFQYGAWLGGRGAIERALQVLAESADDRALALSARLYVGRNDPRSALERLRAIRSAAIARHPQVIVERDRALALLGRESLAERARWLAAVSALDDEWIAERRASLLIEQGDWHGARRLLETTRFQLVHQRYERTRMWRQLEHALGLTPIENPAWLGEDDLAEFGAYRDHSTDGS
jgi:hypothetical protein